VHNNLVYEKNIGITDLIIRFVIFDLLVSVSFLGTEIPVWIAAICFFGSFYLLFTMLFRFDISYAIFGISTREAKAKKQPEFTEH